MKTFNYTTHSKQVLGDMHTPVIHRPLSTGKYRYEQWYSHSQLSGQ